MTRAEVVEKRVSESGELYRTILRNAYEGKASPLKAIKAMCLHCCGSAEENVRATIAACSGFSCPLWKYRPYQKEGGAEPRINAAPAAKA